jgi:hypothetical protein
MGASSSVTQVNTLRAILVTNPFAYPFEVPLEEQFRKRSVIWASVVLQSASTATRTADSVQSVYATVLLQQVA